MHSIAKYAFKQCKMMNVALFMAETREARPLGAAGLRHAAAPLRGPVRTTAGLEMACIFAKEDYYAFQTSGGGNICCTCAGSFRSLKMKRLRISRKLGIIIMLSKYLPPHTTLDGGEEL